MEITITPAVNIQGIEYPTGLTFTHQGLDYTASEIIEDLEDALADVCWEC